MKPDSEERVHDSRRRRRLQHRNVNESSVGPLSPAAGACSGARIHGRLHEPRRLLGKCDGNGVLDDARAREVLLERALAAQDRQRNAALLRDDLLDGRTIDRNGRRCGAGSLERAVQRAFGLGDEIVLLFRERRMNLEVELPVAPTREQRAG